MSHRQGGALHPPPNFSLVDPGVVRSAYPLDTRHVAYLRQHVGVRTVLTLSLEHLSGPVLQAFSSAAAAPLAKHSTHGKGTEPSPTAGGCAVYCIHAVAPMHSTSFGSLDQIVHAALDYVLDANFHPLLLCCPQGDMETSAVVVCLRRLQGWSLSAAISEAELFCSLPTSQAVIRRDVRVCGEGFVFEPSHFSLEAMNQRKAARNATFENRTRGGELGSLMRSVLRGEARPGLLQKYRSGRGRRLSVTSDPDVGAGHAEVSQGAEEHNPEESSAAVLSATAPSASSSLEQHANIERRRSDAFDHSVHPSASLVAALQRANGSLLLVPNRLIGGNSQGALAPHERFWWVRNPPVLDGRSTFNKVESLVEEDDD